MRCDTNFVKAWNWTLFWNHFSGTSATIKLTMTNLINKFKRDIGGILWLAFALFLAMALYSFNPGDPSFNSAASGGVLKVYNLCGYFGSFLSDLLYQSLGVTSWLLVLGAFKLSISSFKGKTASVGSIQRAVCACLLVLVFSSLCSLYFPSVKVFKGHISLGGLFGALLSRGLVTAFNAPGVAVILWTTVAVLLVFYTERRLHDLARPLYLSALRAWQKKKTIIAVPKPSVQITPPAVAAKEVLETAEFPIEKNKLSQLFTFKKDAINITQVDQSKISKLKAAFQKTVRQIENWQLPNLELLADPPGGKIGKIDEREITRNARLVEQKLSEFDVLGQVVEVKPGPAVTMYEFRPAASIKINDITKLADDLSLALSAESLRIIAPIPGRDVVGIETSNSSREPIFMKELVECSDFWSEDIKLPIALGKSVTGEPKIVDLRKIPHLLICGTTGSGKSVFTMSLVTSLIMRHSPKTLKLILIDPKQVDLAAFHKLPHLLLPAVKDAKPAINTLKWLIREMEKRYRSMSRFSAKNIEGYNSAIATLKKDDVSEHEEKIRVIEENPQTAMQSYYVKNLPYIVAVIEEFADLMSVDRAGVEPAVVRLAQMARASGIHLVIAMQSPRREVLTGLIKTNFPGRIAFKVASKVDSSIVLDQRGAERLLSVGDMLYLAPGVSQPQRYHGAFLKDEEMAAVTEFWMAQGEPQFEPTAVSSLESAIDGDDFGENRMGPENEENYDEVVSFVASQKEVSASLLQRRFRFGYPKAARLIEIMENEGVVGPSNGSKPRQVLLNKLE
jgi:S-DNA-T family DNA segregation ATPase FtsK/SpoIIIE